MEWQSRIDMVVFGATGFTGKFVVKEVLRLAQEDKSLTWAIAGRNRGKLEQILESEQRDAAATDSPGSIIVADVGDTESLSKMAAQAKVVLNCVGPYRFYGEPVVKACVEAGTHHVDISGEPLFLESTELHYDEEARRQKICVVGACGFDSIPCDMGVEYTRRQFGDGEMNQCESYLRFRSGPEGTVIHYGTWESAVHGLGSSAALKKVRRQLNKEPLPKGTFRLKPRGSIHHSDAVGAWCIPFIGSDRSVVMRTQRREYMDGRRARPIQMGAYMQLPSLFYVAVLAIWGALFVGLASCRPGRWLLLKYPAFFSAGVFTHRGPTDAQLKGAGFQITFVAQGWSEAADSGERPTKKVVTRVRGPEVGYVATPICMVEAAYALLRHKLGETRGGVVTPATAFADTDLIERLNSKGVKFDVISNE